MKKKAFLILILSFVAIAANLFAATIDSKFGYKDLKWGTSLSRTKLAGYELNPVDDELLEAEQKGYKKDIQIYTLKNLQDKAVNQVWLYYANDNLFYVIERLNKTEIKEPKLVARYGKLSPTGFRKLENNLYGDSLYENDVLQNETIKVQVFNDSAIAMFYDWDVYSKISKEALRNTQKATVVDELEEVAAALMKKIESKRKSSCAFVALSSDNDDKITENYITDALTEAVFYFDKVRIVERSNLQKILEEQKFQSSGLVDENSAKEIGKIAGVDYVCYGTLKRSGDMFSVNSRIVDVQSGEVIAIGRGDVRKDKYIIDADNAKVLKIEADKKAEKQKAEENKKAEKIRLEAEKKAEAERKAEEERLAAEQRAEEERLAEERRIAEKYKQLTINEWKNGKLVKESEGGTEENWFKFVADSSNERIYLKFSTATDLYVYLYDEDFNQIGNTISDYASSGEVRYATRTVVSGKTYYIKVIPGWGHSGYSRYGSYWIGVTSFPAQPETVITQLQADNWANGKLIRASEGGTEENWFKFVADSANERIYLKFSTATDLYVYLYDEDFNQIGNTISDYASSGEVRYATRTVVSGKTYYIKVIPGWGHSGCSRYGSYWVGFTSKETGLR
ncbi:MAG: CsgG/HfaB family protein [Treponema sp.]|nr:CsgG/HfaB family protein [Treponema sp.]